MYKGQRDPMLGIVVRQNQCDEYTSKDGTKWIEVYIPYRDCNPPEWAGSIMVEPEHVCFIDDTYNEIFVNAGAEIKIIKKYTDELGNRRFGETQVEVSEMILARILQYEQSMKHPKKPLKNLEGTYLDFLKSGLTMYNYILRNC